MTIDPAAHLRKPVYVPRSQNGPRHATSVCTLRRLEIGEHRRVGDYWLNHGTDLLPVEPESIARWLLWRNRVTAQHCPHYRIVLVDSPVPLPERLPGFTL